MKKIASSIVLGLILLLFVLWWGFIRAPGPVEVCNHIVEVTRRETAAQGISRESEAKLVESIGQSCIEHKQNKILLRGRIKYAEYAKCVMRGQTLLEIGHC